MKNILIVSTTAMGDSLWGSPGIREIRRTFPDANIDLILNWNWLPLFKHNPHLNNLYAYRNRWYTQLVLGLKLLFKPKYSEVFIFHANKDFCRMKFFLKSAPLWHHQNHNWCPSEFKVIPKNLTVHAIERRNLMLKEIKIKQQDPRMEIFFSPNERHSFFNYKSSVGPEGAFVVLHIGASTKERQWAPNNFRDLANLILKETPLNIVFGGSKKEYKILKDVGLPDNKKIFEAFKMPLLDYAYLLSRASIIISNNTGPMHIGYAVQTPTIGIFLNSPKSNWHPNQCGPYKINKALFPVVSAANGTISLEKVWQKFKSVYAMKTNARSA